MLEWSPFMLLCLYVFDATEEFYVTAKKRIKVRIGDVPIYMYW
jgi:hypothetical protein